MSIWTLHPEKVALSAAYASYFISYICLGTAPLIMSWLSDIIPQDPEVRSLVVGVTIAGYYAIATWSQVLVWTAVQAPQARLAIFPFPLVCRYNHDLPFALYRYPIPPALEKSLRRGAAPRGDRIWL